MEEKEKKPNYNRDSKVLRTYTSDMADAIRTDEVSVIKIALAEKEKRDQEAMYQKAEGTKTSKILLMIGGVVLIVGAIIGSYLLIQKKKDKDTPMPTPEAMKTFISYNASSDIDVTDASTSVELMDAIKKQERPTGGLVKVFFLTQKVNNLSESITSKRFISILKTSIPGPLIRSLADKFLLGRYSNQSSPNERDKSAMFLILETNDYNQAYISMLEWEETMLRDLFVLFNITNSEGDNSIFEKPWRDTIVNNKDARVLYDDEGQAILYYVFMNKSTFVIANNQEALKEIIARLIIKNSQL